MYSCLLLMEAAQGANISNWRSGKWWIGGLWVCRVRTGGLRVELARSGSGAGVPTVRGRRGGFPGWGDGSGHWD